MPDWDAPFGIIWRARNPLGLPPLPGRESTPRPPHGLVTIDYRRAAAICANPVFLSAAYNDPIAQVYPVFMRVKPVSQHVDY